MDYLTSQQSLTGACLPVVQDIESIINNDKLRIVKPIAKIKDLVKMEEIIYDMVTQDN